MKKIVLFIKILVLGCGLVIFAGIIYFTFFFSLLGSAKDQFLLEASSPDKNYTVAIFNRIGGATVSNTTLVSIRQTNENLDIHQNSILFSRDGIKNVNVIWTGNNQLTILYEPGEIYTQIKKWRDVDISYIKK